jgi:hypothetical protein
MKNILFITLLLICCISINAQVPEAFNYQAVVRNSSGDIISNQQVKFRISILTGSETGTTVYSETHSVVTNDFGLANLKIGTGSEKTGIFSPGGWGIESHFIKIELDENGGNAFRHMGTSQLLAVPYAFHAQTVENAEDADSDPENELQELHLSGTVLSLSGSDNSVTLPSAGEGGDNWGTQIVQTDESINGNGTSASPLGVEQSELFPEWGNIQGIPEGFSDNIDNVEDNDHEITNELQTLSISGSELFISDGNSVVLPLGEGGDNWGTQTVATDVTLTGLGIESNPLRINDGGVTSAKILDESILTHDIADFQITGKKLANNSVTTEKINAGAVTGIKIAQAGATSGQVLKWNGTTWSPAEDNQGGITLPFSETASSDGPLFNVVNLGTSGAISTLSNGNYGIWGESANSNGIGVYGVNKTSTGTTYGVRGEVWSSSGYSGYFPGGRFYIEGNTGIGTLNPSSRLEVNGQLKITGGNPGMGKILTSDDNGLASWQESASNIWQENDGSIYYNSGNVGIGLINPTGVLELYGNSVDSYPQLLLSEADGYARVTFRTMTASSKHWVLAGNTNSANGDSQFHLNYYNGSTGKNIISVFGDSRINIDGNVGIGTTNPGYKLDIAGQINLNKGITNDQALYVNSKEALWSDGEYFSWGYGGNYNYFAKPVTIKSTSVPGYDLVVNGTAAKTGGGSWSNLSDIRLKNVLGNYDKGLKEIMALQPIRFKYKDGNPRQLSSEEEQIGFIAQEVQEIFPEAVNQCPDGYLDFNMHSVNVALVNAVKELKAENDRLKTENKQILNRLEKIETIVAATAQKTK